MKPPCYRNGTDCPKRHPGCHDTCEAWAKWRTYKEKIYAQRLAAMDDRAARRQIGSAVRKIAMKKERR